MKNLNWYKIATLMDEISRFGPESPLDPEDPEDKPRIEWLAQKLNVPFDKVVSYLQQHNGLMYDWYSREYFTNQYGWSVPSQEAIEKIKKFVEGDSVLEIGSGYGMWAKLMKDDGISIYATDHITAPGRDAHVPHKKSFIDVEDLNAERALQKYYGTNVLMMSWPPYESPMAATSLESFGGNKLIFIGEGQGGCTADDRFFSILEKEWQSVGEVDIPRWTGIGDYLSFWRRK